MLEKIRSEYDQIMDDINLDKVNFAGFDPKAKENAQALEQNKVKGAATTRMLTDLISLIRHAVGMEDELAPFGDSVNQRFEQWLAQYQKQGKTFTPEQMKWLNMMKDHIATSITIEKDDFDNVPFYEKGGLMKVWQLFGDELDQIIEEMNQKLVA